jgi:hypothetical protein
MLPLVTWVAALAQDNPAQTIASRKARRDQAVRLGGEDAAAFIRQYGDLAVNAILRCTDGYGEMILRGTLDTSGSSRALVAYWKDGKLELLPDPRAALALVAAHGKPVCSWMIAHHDELTDPDAFATFSAEPLEYAYELRALDQGIAEMKKTRQDQFSSRAWSFSGSWRDGAMAAAGAAVLAVVFLLVRRWRRPAAA